MNRELIKTIDPFHNEIIQKYTKKIISYAKHKAKRKEINL